MLTPSVQVSGKIAIIGAGPVGISAARALKASAIAYDQFEADGDVGGNWRHGVYKSAHIISSRKTTEFPDYPMPEDYPDFPSAAQMLAYLNDYVSHYQLRQNIRFNSRVNSIAPAGALWLVRLDNGEELTYEGVIVCNGHHWDCRWPDYPGTFTGEMIHSKDYREPSQLKGKRVLVIGGGNSACDIACEAARVAKSCTLSMRRGYWFLPKTFFGKPTAELLTTVLPVWMQRIYLRILLKIVVGDYSQYGLPEPDHEIFEKHPTINSELLHYLKHGKIEPRGDIKEFDGRAVVFAEGRRQDFDLVVCGTGFNVSMPFLAPGLVDVEGAVVKAYWGIVPARQRQLYIYGWGQARYGFGPLLTPASELIARLIILQRGLKHPLGDILGCLKQPLATDHLLDPMATLRQIWWANRMLPLLAAADKFLKH